MEVINDNNLDPEMEKNWEKSRTRGKIMAGLLIIGAGVLFLLKEMGMDIPYWILSWKMFLIALGLIIFVKHPFKDFGGVILMLIGFGFLLEDISPDLNIGKYLFPVLVILIGLAVIFKPKRKYRNKWEHWAHKKKEGKYYNYDYSDSNSNSENQLEINSVFAGVKRNIITKDFKGGEVSIVFGGAEINLSQADITGKVRLEINQIFGGTSLIVPSHWHIQSEINAILGGVEDKRTFHPDQKNDEQKILVLEGNAIFGSIEIKSY